MSGTLTLFPGPHLHWRLLWALRFRDGCTGRVIDAPLVVTVPELRLRAARGVSDPTWRLLVDIARMPAAGPDVAVTVIDPAGAYVLADALAVPRVHPLIVHPPPVLRDDFVRDVTLWPTRGFPLPSGETAVVGRLLSAAGAPLSGYRVAMAHAATVPPGTPAAPTNANGEFVLRLPGVRRLTPPETTADLAVAVTDGGSSVALGAVAPPGTAADSARVALGSSTLVTLTAA